jgi:hypothetical protein
MYAFLSIYLSLSLSLSLSLALSISHILFVCLCLSVDLQSINLKKLIENGLIHFYSNESDTSGSGSGEEYLLDGYDESLAPSGRFITVTLPSAPAEPLSLLSSASPLSTKLTQLLSLLGSSPPSGAPSPIVFLDDLTAIELCFEDNGRSLISALHSYLSSGQVHSLSLSLFL